LGTKVGFSCLFVYLIDQPKIINEPNPRTMVAKLCDYAPNLF